METTPAPTNYRNQCVARNHVGCMPLAASLVMACEWSLEVAGRSWCKKEKRTLWGLPLGTCRLCQFVSRAVYLWSFLAFKEESFCPCLLLLRTLFRPHSPQSLVFAPALKGGAETPPLGGIKGRGQNRPLLPPIPAECFSCGSKDHPSLGLHWGLGFGVAPPSCGHIPCLKARIAFFQFCYVYTILHNEVPVQHGDIILQTQTVRDHVDTPEHSDGSIARPKDTESPEVEKRRQFHIWRIQPSTSNHSSLSHLGNTETVSQLLNTGSRKRRQFRIWRTQMSKSSFRERKNNDSSGLGLRAWGTPGFRSGALASAGRLPESGRFWWR